MIGGYKVSKKIRESAHTLILRAIREQDQLPFIFKVLKGSPPEPAALSRFRHEYEIVSNLEIPGIIRSYSLERIESGLLIIYQDIGGVSLQALLEERPLPFNEFMELALQITETIGHLQEKHIIHKDICPENIIVNPATWEAKLCDFSIASYFSVEHPQAKALPVLEGTLAYMSPEQTGRVNRPLDYRTDFYSLGASFYRMVTSSPPFDSEDPNVLAHCHLARNPIPAHRRNPEVPKALSMIISKLMEKKAEDRYQSVSGLLADLKHIRDRGTQQDFSPGQQDFSLNFEISQTRYGREEKVEDLINIFHETCHGETQMALVTGSSGVGKTVLVQELYRPILKEKGYFISGKFDPLKRNVPFSAVVNALGQFVQQLATESDQRFSEWGDSFRRALAPNGQVLLEVVPELELIIGPQPPVPVLEPTEALNRFQRTMRRFMEAIAQDDTVTVLFLDDLQWADSASLQFISSILTDRSLHRLMIIGAYRDQEVPPMHPLARMLADVRQQGGKLFSAHLDPLVRSDVIQLLADTLNVDPESVSKLASITIDKTLGNPFTIKQFLYKLHADGLIQPQSRLLNATQQWVWDVEKIKTSCIADNVADILLERLRGLSSNTQRVLRFAACIGYRFDLQTLAMIHGASLPTTYHHLQAALSDGFVIPLSELRTADEQDSFSPLLIDQFCFQHDRIHQAAYDLSNAEDQQQAHLAIGRELLRRLSDHMVEERLFEIVDHLNRGCQWIEAEDHRLNLIKLNRRAARKAYDATAYNEALTYIQSAHKQLPSKCWKYHYELASTISCFRAELEYLNGNFELCNKFVNLTLRHAKTDLEKAGVYCTRIGQLTLLAKFDQASAVGRKALQLLGVDYPGRDPRAAGQKAFSEVANKLAGTEPLSLLDQAEASDRKILLAQRCLRYLTITAFLGNQSLWPWIVSTSVRLSIEYGNAPESAVSYANFGILQGAFLNNYKTGYGFGQLALRLCDRFHDQAPKAAVFLIVGAELMPWSVAAEDARQMITRGYKEALESGFILWAGWLLMYEILLDFFRGERIQTILFSIKERLDFVRRTNNLGAVAVICGFEIMLAQMSNAPLDSTDSTMDHQAEILFLQNCEDQRFFMALCLFKITKAHHLFCLGDFKSSLALTNEIEPQLSFIINHPNLADRLHIQALSILAIAVQEYRCLNSTQEEKIKTIIHQLNIWAENCPHNYLAKKLMVEAQLAHVSKQYEKAHDLFDLAIDASHLYHMLHDEALANELAARSILSRKPMSRIGVMYLRHAHHAYMMWGAMAKLQQLEHEFPQLLTEYRNRLELAYSGDHSQSMHKTISGLEGNQDLDMATLLKACEAIAGAVVHGSMLENLLEILIENAGAQRGVILLSTDGHLSIAAESQIIPIQIELDRQTFQQKTTLLSVPIDSQDAENLLPLSLIAYVSRTKDTIVLDDATKDNVYISHDYRCTHTPKSILCQPILHQGALIGVLYLENSLTTSAFTAQNTKFISLLSGQVAISISNARLVENLEAEVRKRTEELEIRTRFIEQIFGSYMSSAVADRLLRSPKELDFAGKRQQATILFSDLRGFTTFSETLPPETVVKLLNNYLSEMTIVIQKYGGTIDAFTGDAIMVVFGTPFHRLRETDHAVACALEMQMVMPKVNAWNLENSIPSIEMGIGLHVGDVVVGNIGSRLRAKYGPVGNTVTICNRIESYTVGGQILMSNAVQGALTSEAIIKRSFVVEPKGMLEPLDLHDVVGMRGEFDLVLPQHTITWVDLDPALPFSFQPIMGKEVVDREQYGLMTRLSQDEAEIQCPTQLPPHTNLKLQMRNFSQDSEPFDFYAKVLPSVLPKGWLKIHFTAISHEAKQQLLYLIATKP